MFDWFSGESHRAKASPEERYSLTHVGNLLDQIGQARLVITSPRLKVLLTKISQNGESHLKRNASDGNPSDVDIMQLQDNLEMLLRVLQQYVEIQNNPQLPDRTERLRDGFNATSGFATKVLSNSVPGGQSSMTAFKVDTKILEAQRYTNT